jgi:hypothetical protein
MQMTSIERIKSCYISLTVAMFCALQTFVGVCNGDLPDADHVSGLSLSQRTLPARQRQADVEEGTQHRTGKKTGHNRERFIENWAQIEQLNFMCCDRQLIYS